MSPTTFVEGASSTCRCHLGDFDLDEDTHYQGCPDCWVACCECGEYLRYRDSWGMSSFGLHEACRRPDWLLRRIARGIRWYGIATVKSH